MNQSLAERLRAARARLASVESTGIPRRPPGPFPASHEQERIWLIDRILGGSTEYNVPDCVSVHGTLDLGALETALTGLVAAHEVLRTVFVEQDGTPRPIVLEPDRVPVTRLTADGRLAALDLAASAAERPFDLGGDLPVRCTVIRYDAQAWLILLTVHHIATDGPSLDLMWRELSARYVGSAPSVPSVQYGDFAHWQRSTSANDLEYWLHRLADCAELSLGPRPATIGNAGAELRFTIPVEVSLRMRSLGTRHGVTPFMVLLAVFKVLLSRLSGQADVIVGTPVSGRDRPELETVLGPFGNTLVLRTDLAGATTFSAVLDRVRETALGAYAHQAAPFAMLVERLRPERELGRNPLFDVLFAFEGTGPVALELPGAEVTRTHVPGRRSKFDLSLTLDDDGRGVLAWATDLFDHDFARRFVDRYLWLLDVLTARPDGDLFALIEDPTEARVLAAWGQGVERDPGGRALPEMIIDQAGRTPDAVAVGCSGEELTYSDLVDRSGRLAARLVDLGLPREGVVGVCLERSVDLVVALLAIWRAGGAYLPLDVRRADYLLADSGARFVITDTEVSGDVRVIGVTDRIAPTSPPEKPVLDLAQAAYLIYTSGSTGRPKGVVVPHRAVLNLTTDMIERIGLTASEVVGAITTPTFDIAVLELLVPLAAGARVELVGRADAVDGHLLGAALTRVGATVVQATPASWAMLVAAGWPGGRVRALCGGEALPAGLAAEIRSRVENLWNVYGPTETTVWSTAQEITPGHAVGLGLPLANTTLSVLDDGLRPVPIGAVGELCIGGLGVARGYANRAALTAQRFLPDPARPGARMYRTGDLVRFHHDGTLEFIGRRDHQVKIRGHRIELGEVESRLGEHPAVAQAVVMAHGVDLDRALVGYLVWRDRPRGGWPEVRESLRASLPDHMLPDIVVELDRLPTTPNGKIDRRALPRPTRAGGGVAPANDREREITAIWADVLGRDDIGVEDDFFALGGHSLRATRVVAAVRNRLGVDVPVRAIFENRTVRALATAIDTAPTATPLRIERDGGAVPLSYAQRRLWFLDRLRPGRSDYLVPSVVRLTGALDLDALHAAISGVVRRHEILRTRFVFDVEPAQVVGAVGPLWTSVVDAGSESDALDIVRELCARPFDLENGPLLRAQVVRISEREHLLAVVFHHAVIDGWSLSVFWREVGAAPEHPNPVQYRDFTRWESTRRGEHEADLEYWRRRLAGSTPTEVPTDHPRPVEFDESAGLVDFVVPEDLAGKVSGGLLGATPFVVLLAGFLATVATVSGQRDVVVGAPVAGRGRERPEFADLIGPLINTVALRVEVGADLAATVERVRAAVLAAAAHQDLPFEHLVDRLRPERDLGRHPLFQIMFALDEDEVAGLRLPGVRVEAVLPGVAAAKFDLSMTLRRTGDRLTGTLVFARGLYEADTANGLIDTYLRLLAAAVEAPHSPLNSLDLMDPITAAALEPRPARLPVARCLHELVALSAATWPDAIAVQVGAESITYRELVARSRRLAAGLRARGAGPGRVVGVVLPRSIDLVVGLLGVFESGSTCLPLPPGQPSDRLDLLLADAGACLVLTEVAEFTGTDTADVGAALPAVAPGSVAYLTYTSGSTGRPKAVPTTHAAAVDYLDHLVGEYGVGADDVVLQLAAVSFDAAIRDIVGPLAAGARLVLLPEDAAKDPYAIRREIVARGVTALLSVVPSLLTALTAVEGEPSRLRLVLTSGEKLTGALARRARCLGPDVVLVNQYGPTECTLTTTYHRVGAEDPVPIGTPRPGAVVLVLGPDGQVLPLGALGELYIGGPGLTMGYPGLPRLTAQRFVPDPYGSPGSRLYRTGDLGRRRPDGRLEFRGRADDQVKIRGVRVEPAEVEAVLLDVPGVSAAAVVAHDVGETELVAFLVSAADPAAVRAEVARRLPDQLRPARYVDLDRLPLTAHGKLDRALLRRSLPAPTPAAVVVRPRDRSELEIQAIWQRVLGRAPIGVNENFFEVGGHSLRAVELVEAIRRDLGVRVPLNLVFLNPTVQAMAAAVRARQDGRPRGLVVRLAAADSVDPPLFLVHPQSGEVCCYVELARLLGAWRSVYGIEAAGYNSDEEPSTDLVAMAHRYVRELRDVRPAGPYLLAGWSFGGNVAVEMAALLESQGERVDFVGVLDARDFAKDATERWYADTDELSRFALVQGVGKGRLADADADTVRTLLTAHLTDQNRLPDSADSHTVRRMIDVFTADGRAADGYRATTAATADLWLFRTRERHPTLTNPVVDPSSWRRRTRGALHVVDIPGNHHDLAGPPHVDELARLMRRAIEGGST
ncbi:amino acid adenylation domain-containing protein [Actinokineospora enzanensis]|uniref:amino acid adenylation domain-containing protein n=1 Tax=Actinokineospora enzanensis TaxID=155975 RepID=UPI00035D0269|nr:non-ribosomal peptide synthetase [Actinokineospora enzanensis]